MPTTSRRSRRLFLESLENRCLLAGDINISISDAPASEGATATAFLGAFVQSQPSGLGAPKGMTFHNGDLFVISSGTDRVLRYGPFGNFVNEFVTSHSGGLDHAFDLAFGPDNNLYVSSTQNDTIIRYDGNTGAYIDQYVPAGSGGLISPRGILFGPDQDLYVASQNSGQILKYQGPAGPSPGAFMGQFASTGSDHGPFGLAYGPDGNLYAAIVPHVYGPVGSQSALGIAYVERFNGATGASLGTFVPTGSGGLQDARHITFNQEGDLIVGEYGSGQEVLRYQGPNGTSPGAFLDVLVPAGLGGLSGTQDVEFDSTGNLYVANPATNEILRYGTASRAAFTVRLSTAATTPVSVTYSTLNGAAMAGTDYLSGSGIIVFSPGETSHTVIVQTLNDSTIESNETFSVALANPVDAIIADGIGIGTITDDDTKFYVVDDAAANKTFEYGGGAGAAGEDYNLNSGDTSPRGAASNIAGDKVWVVDANKNVYVYNTSGGLLGSWSAGSLAANADVQGITTNGTDVWLVDAKQDKVFKYTGAATRLSGSQNAASSFNLNGSNTSPSDLVTDGSSIWVLNNSTTDKIFKYTAAGSLLGSWTISGAGTSPTGLTIDPASVSSIWIVDSGTDRVYEFASATSRTSGSATPTTSFALAAGNTNPQGIADPPSTTALTTSFSSPADLSLDAALLGIVSELDGLLGTGGKKRG